MNKIPQNNLKIEVKKSKEVFTLFCVLNALGYDEENNAKGMSPVRKRVRKILSKHNWNEKYPELKKIIGKYHQYYLLKALFTKSKKISSLNRFVSHLKKISKEKIILKLWKIDKTYQMKEAKRIYPLFKREINRLIKFIGKSPKQIEKFILIANPLDAYWRGYGFVIQKTAYVIVGPGAQDRGGRLIRHELLHILKPILQILLPAATNKDRMRLAAMGYGTRRAINEEYLVRSLNLLYESEILKKSITKDVKNEEKIFPRFWKAMALVKKEIEKGRP